MLVDFNIIIQKDEFHASAFYSAGRRAGHHCVFCPRCGHQDPVEARKAVFKDYKSLRQGMGAVMKGEKAV